MAALAFCSTAGAGSTVDLAGAEKGKPFSVHFTVVSQGGKPIKVKNFRFENLRITCTQGNLLLSTRVRGQIPVHDKRFEATATDDDPPSEANVKGKFVKPTKVRGRVKAEGSFETSGGETFTNCSGAKRYTAS